MAVSDNSYSRLIAWLKILLPLGALAILSSLFLVSEPRTPAFTQLPPDQIGGDTAYEPHISAPSLSGVTKNGSTYTLFAKRATPSVGSEDILTLSEFAGTLTSIGGLQIDVSAPHGIIHNLTSTAILSQGVRLITSDGYDIRTKELQADFADTVLSTPGSIRGTGPMGHFSAGQMILRQQSGGATPGSYELVFKNGVNVVYQPGN